MNSKKANRAFLISIILYIVCVMGVTFVFPSIADNLVTANLLCEAVILFPGLLFVTASEKRPMEFLGFRKMKIATVLAVIPFTVFTMPLISLLNLISQFFVTNAVSEMITSYDMSQLTFVQMFFTMAIFAPVCEEVVCRGIYYRSYKKYGGAFKAMLVSALIFAMVHMNLNQACYAFAMGIMAVLLVEATGSLWSAILYHGLINGSQVVIMYTTLQMQPEIYNEVSVQGSYTETLVYGVAAYLVLTAIFLPLGWFFLVWMSGHEGRSGILTEVWQDRKKNDRIVSFSLILALVLCVAFMVSLVF